MSGPILDAIFFRQIKHANGVGKAPWSSICRPFLDQKREKASLKGWMMGLPKGKRVLFKEKG